MHSNAGPSRASYEHLLRAFAKRHDFRVRSRGGSPRAVAPDGTLEVVLVEMPTVEPGYSFELRAPAEPALVQRVLGKLRRRRREHVGASFSILPRPAHTPFAEAFTGDAAFDAAYVIRPATDATRARVRPEVRAALMSGPRQSLHVESGVFRMPWVLVADDDVHAEREKLRAVRQLVMLVAAQR